MSGMFPDSGVPANQALNTTDVPTTNCDPAGELFHSTSRCQPRFDPASANAVMSEILNAIDCAGLVYDCSRLDNLCLAIQALTAETITTITNTIAGNRIATYTNELGVAVDINETVTSIINRIAGHVIGTYLDENGAPSDIRETITTISGTNVGNQIATYTNESGTVLDINETVTNFQNTDSNTLQYTNENGVNQTVDIFLRQISGNNELAFPDDTVIPIVAPVFTPGVGSMIINNPFNVPITIDLEAHYHVQIRSAGDSALRFEGRMLVDAVPTQTYHAVVSGPARAQNTNDDTELRGRSFVTVPAAGSVTITHEYRAFLDAGPFDPLNDVVENFFRITWFGSQIELV